MRLSLRTNRGKMPRGSWHRLSRGCVVVHGCAGAGAKPPKVRLHVIGDGDPAARQRVVSDGYEMSIGEVINLYQQSEITINPDFQRLFRWDLLRKTRFIESLLLRIPIPPIFVYQEESGIWELIHGLQRLSTVFEFVGILRSENGSVRQPSVLEGTNFLPSLAGRRWEPSGDGAADGIGTPQQLQIKRARIRVEILRQESDPQAKYELFQRLNTGGASLSEQGGPRYGVAVMIDRPFHRWLLLRAGEPRRVPEHDCSD